MLLHLCDVVDVCRTVVLFGWLYRNELNILKCLFDSNIV